MRQGPSNPRRVARRPLLAGPVFVASSLLGGWVALALPLMAQSATPPTVAATPVAATPVADTPSRAAAEPAPCRDPFGADARGAHPGALGSLARRCREPAVAELLAMRAEHAEQLRRLRVMSGLLRPRGGHGGDTDRARLAQCRMYAALAEAFAERLQRERPSARAAALEQLNLAYAQAIHIAERAIAGHERIVGLPDAPR